MITVGNVLNANGQPVGDTPGLGDFGNFIYGKQISQGLAWTLEREVGNLKPYRADTYNVPVPYFHGKQLPAAGLAQRISFFDGSVAAAGVGSIQTNWPGPNGLPGNIGFALRRLSVDLEPLLNIEANPPAYASTPAAMMVTTNPLNNAIQAQRFLKTCFWEFLVANRLIASGLGLQDLPVIGGAYTNGQHSNTTATIVNSSLSTRNGGPGDSGFEFDVPLAIFPGDRVEFRVTPGIPNLVFLDSTGTNAISSLIVKMHGKKIEDR